MTTDPIERIKRWRPSELDRLATEVATLRAANEALREAVVALDERVRRGGPSNWQHFAQDYMSGAAAAAARAALASVSSEGSG